MEVDVDLLCNEDPIPVYKRVCVNDVIKRISQKAVVNNVAKYLSQIPPAGFLPYIYNTSPNPRSATESMHANLILSPGTHPLTPRQHHDTAPGKERKLSGWAQAQGR